MTRTNRRRKCKYCRNFFTPDPRNYHKQKYCGQPACRKASKAAAQARWLAKEENQDYFRNPENVLRVQQWRRANPGYWRRQGKNNQDTLQDHLNVKSTQKQDIITQLPYNALQDILKAQLPVFVGLIAKLTGSALQDDIVKATRHLQQLGTDILNPFNLHGGDYAKTTYPSRPDPPGS